MRNDRLKNVILVVLAICLIGLTVAFAVMSSNLNISGTASVNKSEWKIHFDNLQNPVASGSADVGTATLSGDKIILTVSGGAFKAPGDKITYIVDVVNEGDFNAKVDVVSTIIGDCASEDGSDVTKYCNKIKAKLIYKDSGEEVKKDDKLKIDESKTLSLIVTYDENKELTDVSSKPITIGNITSTITYIMDDNNGDSGGDEPSKPAKTVTAICKRAETLHTEECQLVGSGYGCDIDGYSADGEKGTTTVTYGNLNTDNAELQSGDAFDCDVNGDGVYDPETERFYYVSDYYDTNSKSFDSDYATLVYYNNVSKGVADNTAVYAYDESGTNVNGPVTAVKELPSISQWSNITLKSNARTILSDKSENTTINSSDSSTLNLTSNFSYDGYSARLLTYQEVAQSCKIGSGLNTDLSDSSALEKLKGELGECNYLFENTYYALNSIDNVGYWLETANSENSTSTWFIISIYEFGMAANQITTDFIYENESFGVRPTIEVSKEYISTTSDSTIAKYPSANLTVYQTGTINKVNSGTWTNSYLDYTFDDIKNGDSKSKIYYCIGEECTPNKKVSNSIVTIKNSGEYIFRYYVKNSDGVVGDIKKFVAKVDTTAPKISVEGNPAEIVNSNVTLKIKATDLESGIKSVLVNGDNVSLTDGIGSYIVKENGTYNIVVTDNAGNVSTDVVEVTKIEKGVLCKRATTLHSEECTQASSSSRLCNGAGYTEDGEKGTTTITYGNLNDESETLTSGDAFDCDVNGDGVYDSETERFYYVSDYYDTSSKTFDSDYATLIYYNNVSSGKANNESSYAYFEGSTLNGPITAIKELPTINEWNNVSLYKETRTILNATDGSTVTNSNTKTDETLPESFSYSGYSARLLTYQEFAKGCGESDPSEACLYLYENTNYSSSKNISGYWVESLYPVAYGGTYYSIYLTNGSIDVTSLNDVLGVRPVIEVKKSNISYLPDGLPKTTVTAYKKGTTTKVSSGIWSNSYLDYSFSSIKNGDDTSKIYYCIGNDCTPNIEVENSKLSIDKDGIYTLRYYVKNSDGTVGKIKEYNAKVDTISPSIIVSGNPTETQTTNVVLKIKVADENSGIKSLKVNTEDITLEDNIGTYIVYENGTYSIIATDNVGNVTTKDVEVTKLEKGITCKRAKVLHTEECERTDDSYYCSSSGYTETGIKGSTIVYGNDVIYENELNSGDAFDCDVNGDGVYDSETERFYYISDYYNTESKEFESDTAVLVYYSNVSKGMPSNSSSSYSSDSNYKTPDVAVKELPTIYQWSNVKLKNNARKILSSSTDFSYSGYSSRLLTIDEIKSGCIDIDNYGTIGKCDYLFENTLFSSDSNVVYGYYLESYNYSNGLTIDGYMKRFSTSYGSGVRPVIEVPKSEISLTDEGVSKSSLTAYKTGTTTEIKSGVWSNSYLDYKFGKMTSNNNDNVMYYCIGDSCTPNIMVGLNEIITIEKDGEYTLRYAEKDSNGDFGEIKEYSAKVDITEPNVTLEGNPTEITNEYVTLKINANDNDSGVRSATVNSENITINDGIGTYTVGTNDTYTVLVTDNAGNITIEPVIVSKIDRGIVCKRATILHTEECNSDSSGECTLLHEKGEMITYGNLSENSTELTSGDAFDCDVNGDGIYDSETERFYYLSDYYDTKKKSFDSDWATLVYYSPVSNGETDNMATYYYDDNSNAVNANGPLSLIKHLPTISKWSNVALKSTTRAILNEKSGNMTHSSDHYGGSDHDDNTLLAENFSYSGYSARLLTLQELSNSCGIYSNFSSDIISNENEMINCEYLFENSDYAYFDTSKATSFISNSFWIETVSSYAYYNFLAASTWSKFGTLSIFAYSPNSEKHYVRTAIDVSKRNISLTSSSDANIIIDVYKTGTKEKVTENTWSDSYLDYKFGNASNKDDNIYVYYCVGKNCTPSNKVEDNIVTINESGEYVFRYSLGSDSGLIGEIKEYNAKVDISAPEVSVSTSNSDENVIVTVNATDLESGIKNVLVSGNEITLTDGVGTYQIDKNGTYAVIATDNVGNSYIQTIAVTNSNTDNVLCKRATTLHTETCNQTNTSLYCSGSGYTESGTKGTTTITYGNLGTSEELTSGDAFDCDVNGDGVYDPETERFYYVSDYYDTSTQEFDSNYVTLIYYSNVFGGESNSSSTFAYDSSSKNYNGPVTAIKQLPTTSKWSNVTLKNTERQILTETGATSTSGGTLPTAFSYSGYSARLLTVQELVNACNIQSSTYTTGELDKCNYFMENTIYSSFSNTYGYWLETPYTASGISWLISGDSRIHYNRAYTSSSWGVRPVIEVEKSNISLSVESNVSFVKVYKTGTNNIVSEDTWSDSYLDFKFGNVTGNNKIYYCTGDDCTPNIEVNQNTTITIKETGNYIFKYSIADNDGNLGQFYKYSAKVDVTSPILTIEKSDNEITNKNITLSITATDNDSEVKNVFVNGNVITQTNGIYSYEVSQNGTYNIVAIDNVGNTIVKVVEVTEIDKSQNVICKRTTTLHTSGSTTYGNLGTSGKLVSGDAFDCDVNGDGTYDSETERFYYVSDYYDTYAKTFDSKTATLIYYSDVKLGEPVSTETTSPYNEQTNSKGENYNGPVTGLAPLPTIKQWSNVSLKMTTRAILNELSGNTTIDSSDSKTVIPLTNKFSYEGYAARFLTLQELEKGCYVSFTKTTSTYPTICMYLSENYTNSAGFWLETVSSSSSSNGIRFGYSYNSGFKTPTLEIHITTPTYYPSSAGVRPVIDVDKIDIEY